MSYDGEEAGGEAGDQVFAGSSAHDGVVGPRNSRAVIGRHHQTHLDELAGVTRQPAKTKKAEETRREDFFFAV